MEIDKTFIYSNNREAVTGHGRQRDAAHGLVEETKLLKTPIFSSGTKSSGRTREESPKELIRVFMDHRHRLNLISRRLSIARASGKPTSDVLADHRGI